MPATPSSSTSRPAPNRLISYGVDQRMTVNGGDVKNTSQLLTGKIVKGVLQLSTEDVADQTYIARTKPTPTSCCLSSIPGRRIGNW